MPDKELLQWEKEREKELAKDDDLSSEEEKDNNEKKNEEVGANEVGKIEENKSLSSEEKKGEFSISIYLCALSRGQFSLYCYFPV